MFMLVHKQLYKKIHNTTRRRLKTWLFKTKTNTNTLSASPRLKTKIPGCTHYSTAKSQSDTIPFTTVLSHV